MHISDVISQTGLTKKAIYYYINEGLLSPANEPKSGYMIFTSEDVRTLQLIRKLRALDLSIEDIRSILDYANTTNYYFVRKLKELNQQRARIDKQETFLKNILDPINLISTRNNLTSLLDTLSLDERSNRDEALDDIDAIMLTMFFWGTFLHDTEITEYQRFLWNRLIKHIIKNQSHELINLRNYFYSLTHQETQTLFAQHNETVDLVVSLTNADYDDFICKMASTISQKMQKPSFVRSWKSNYLSYFHPSTVFFDSQASDIMREFSPRFLSYQQNINVCCSGLRDYLNKPEGVPLRNIILDKLGSYIDIDGHHSGELAALYSFF